MNLAYITLQASINFTGIFFNQSSNPVDIQKPETKDFGVLAMDKTNEQRREHRLRYHWLMQFARSVKEQLSQGRMVDLSSQGAAFVCLANNCPNSDKLVTTRFSVPHFDSDKAFDWASFNRFGRVCRIDNINSSLRRVAIQFTRPLPFKPGEQGISEYDRTYKLATGSDGITAALSLQLNPEMHYETTQEQDFR